MSCPTNNTNNTCPCHHYKKVSRKLPLWPRKQFWKKRKNLFRGSSRKLLLWTCSRGSKNAGRGSFAEGPAEGLWYVQLKYEGKKIKTHLCFASLSLGFERELVTNFGLLVVWIRKIQWLSNRFPLFFRNSISTYCFIFESVSILGVLHFLWDSKIPPNSNHSNHSTSNVELTLGMAGLTDFDPQHLPESTWTEAWHATQWVA